MLASPKPIIRVSCEGSETECGFGASQVLPVSYKGGQTRGHDDDLAAARRWISIRQRRLGTTALFQHHDASVPGPQKRLSRNPPTPANAARSRSNRAPHCTPYPRVSSENINTSKDHGVTYPQHVADPRLSPRTAPNFALLGIPRLCLRADGSRPARCTVHFCGPVCGLRSPRILCRGAGEVETCGSGFRNSRWWGSRIWLGCIAVLTS